jgi:hypothetical protein
MNKTMSYVKIAVGVCALFMVAHEIHEYRIMAVKKLTDGKASHEVLAGIGFIVLMQLSIRRFSEVWDETFL